MNLEGRAKVYTGRKLVENIPGPGKCPFVLQAPPTSIWSELFEGWKIILGEGDMGCVFKAILEEKCRVSGLITTFSFF